MGVEKKKKKVYPTEPIVNNRVLWFQLQLLKLKNRTSRFGLILLNTQFIFKFLANNSSLIAPFYHAKGCQLVLEGEMFSYKLWGLTHLGPPLIR